MADLFNFETNQVETIPDREVTRAVASGQFGFRKNEQIPVRLSDGRQGLIPSEKAFQTFNEGTAQFLTKDELTKINAEKEATSFTGFLKGSAAALASGLSLGISDKVFTSGDTPESVERKAFLNAFRDENPGTSLSLNVLGAFIPALASGGLGAAGSAARVGARGAVGTAANLTPAGLAINAGRAIESGVQAGLRRQLGSAAGKRISETVIPRVASGAIEGGAFAAGGLLSEDALGRAEFNGESLAASLGFGALLGGALGGATGLPAALTQKGFQKTAKASASRVAAARKAVEDFADVAKKEGTASANQAKKVVDQFSDDILSETNVPRPSDPFFDPTDISPFTFHEKAVSTVGQISPEQARFFTKNFRQIVDSPDDPDFLDIVKDALLRESDDLPGIEDSIRKLGQQRQPLLDRATTQINIGDIAQRATRIANQSRGRGITSKDRLKVVKRFERFVEDLKDRNKILNKNVSARQAFEEIEDLRKELPKVKKDLGRDVAQDFERGIFELDNFISAQIKNDPAIGSQFSQLQSELGKLLGTRNVLRKIVDRENPGNILRTLRKDFEGKLEPNFTRQGQPNELQALVDASNFTQFNGNRATLRDLFKKSALREQLISNGALAAEAGTDARRRIIKSIAGSVLGADLLAAGQRVGAAGSAIGAARGFLFKRLIDDSNFIGRQVSQRLKNLNDLKTNVTNRLRKGAQGFVDDTGKNVNIALPISVNRAVVPSITRTINQFRLEKQSLKEENDNERALRLSNNLDNLQNSQLTVSGRLARNLKPVSEFAPKISNEAAGSSLRALNFLTRVAPKDPFRESLVKQNFIPNDTQTTQFAQAIEAIEDPLGVIERSSTGFISQIQVDALRVVYPTILADFQQMLIEELQFNEKTLSLQAQQALSLILGQPVSPQLNGRFIRNLQSLNIPEERQEQSAVQGRGPNGLSVTGLRDLERGEDKETETQRIQKGIRD